MDRRSYLTVLGAGSLGSIAGCAGIGYEEPESAESAEPSDPATESESGESEPQTDESTGGEPGTVELRILNISVGRVDEKARQLSAAPKVPVRITAVFPVLSNRYDVRVTIRFHRDGEQVAETATTVQGEHETDETYTVAERTETITINTMELPPERLEMVVILEDLTELEVPESNTTLDVTVRQQRWREHIAETETALSRALDEFRNGSDGTILEVGFEEYAASTATEAIRDASRHRESGADALPTDIDPGSVFERLSREIKLVENLIGAHSKLVDVFDDIETMQAQIDAGDSPASQPVVNPGPSRSYLNERIKLNQSKIETRLETAVEVLGRLETATAEELHSEHYAEKIEQLDNHLDISERLLDALTQFVDTVDQLQQAQNAEGELKQTYAERAIIRLDVFVRGIDTESEPHDSITPLIKGVSNLDAHESLDPLIDHIVEMAERRREKAIQLRDEGLREKN
jgi:hypothetical protein